MPPKKAADLSADSSRAKKRKTSPQPSSSAQNPNTNNKRVKLLRDARSILTQTTDAALNNGELDLQSFLKSREFEIRALQDGMQRAKKSLTARAFQQVPRHMRRRTASHNVKRVPKRLQKRAKREMREDNTPTVDSSKRKSGSSRGKIRAETAKRLGILAAMKSAKKAKGAGITTRAARPKIRKNLLNNPQKPKSKFRKRQIHKTWLPTHMWHAKRARMTEPKNPLWRFSIPITCVEKSYRPTHRAAGARGVVAWDMSYMSTISLDGPVESLEKALKAFGLTEQGLWERKNEKWRSGSRSWNGWLSREIEDQRVQIAPATVVWCAQQPIEKPLDPRKKGAIRQLFIRVHPSAFLEAWTELIRLSKLQRPSINVQDLRYEIGSIDITGSGSTEALCGILHPYQHEGVEEDHGRIFKSLIGATNSSSLPPNSLLSFSIEDPRLRYPSRTVAIPKPTDEEANFTLLQTLSAWPADVATIPSALFDRDLRFKATRLPAQKSINRRKSQVRPKCYPPIVATDPPIPIMLLTSRMASATSAQGTWTLLAPWKCILPIWYGLLHYPLSSGGNPRFGGLNEIRQIHFENRVPWFPADFPGTNAGFSWEADERLKKKADWEKRPKGKRIEWGSLNLGAGRKGEIGQGWACDFERLLVSLTAEGQSTGEATLHMQKERAANPETPIRHLSSATFASLIASSDADLPPFSVAPVLIRLVSRGVATQCARIYRLPAPSLKEQSAQKKELPPGVHSPENEILLSSVREQWLSLIPSTTKSKPPPGPKSKAAKNYTRMHFDAPMPQRIRLLAQSLLENPTRPYPANKNENGHPLIPDEEDLIGFVTTGEFNLAEGKGVAVGTVVVTKAVEGLRREDQKEVKGGRWCVVRNAGENIGRLARWDPL